MFVMSEDCLSPHQLPLARALVAKLGVDNFRYVYRDRAQADRVALGWEMAADATWQLHLGSHSGEAKELIENADTLLTMFREPDLMARRQQKGLTTFYASERWFKPLTVRLCGVTFDWMLPGRLRMFHPQYAKMARAMAWWLKTDPKGYYLHVGPWAKKDLRSLGVPDSKMIPWGYFVDPSTRPQPARGRPETGTLKILYLGRLLKLKRVDTIIRALARLRAQQVDCRLSIVGSGPAENVLRRLVEKLGLGAVVSFQPAVPIAQVRGILRAHDVLVFSSNALDGWGAVVSEALEEGVPVLGTCETGASPTLLPDTNLFSCGDDSELAQRLLRYQACPMPKAFTAEGAADRLLAIPKEPVMRKEAHR